jgi:predicted dehydrogenase
VSHPTTRRFFLGAATAAAATRVWGANDKANVGIVGLGGRGTNHLDAYSKNVPGARVAGLCDVDQASRERAQARLKTNGGDKAKEFEDMRQMFSDPGIDAVSIATPNHWHALASIWAMKAGKDVYCEKPACYNIHEGQQMLKVSRETKRLVQIGSQHRSIPWKMKAIQSLQQGLIGPIYMAKGLCFKRRPSIGHAADQPTPKGVNWDLFLGPAPMRPYNPLRFKYNWHWFWDTGNGDIGNQGVHEMGVARWALGDPEWPKTAYAQGGKYAYNDDQETPNTLLASYDFGGRELVFEVRGLTTDSEGAAVQSRPRPSADGAVAPKQSVIEKALPYTTPMRVMVGNLFFGSEGWACMANGFQAFKGESNELIAEEHAASNEDTTALHMQNFLDACRSRNEKDLHDPLSNAYLSAGLCHLANISYRVGSRKLTLEAGPTFKGDPEANKLLTRDKYRAPYIV